MKEVKGSMNIPFTQLYDPEDDIYYVTFRTGEPSYCEEIDDVLLLERGIFTKLPTGFRILNFHKNPIQGLGIGILEKKIKQTLENTKRDFSGAIRSRENQIGRALEKVLA